MHVSTSYYRIVDPVNGETHVLAHAMQPLGTGGCEMGPLIGTRWQRRCYGDTSPSSQEGCGHEAVAHGLCEMHHLEIIGQLP